jgi:HSP20 family molecular chaperone IbpA
LSKDNRNIHFDRGELTRTGRSETWDRENLKSYYCERFDGHYRRVFTFDDTDKIYAKLVQGVLELTIPKVEAMKHNKIEIRVL